MKVFGLLNKARLQLQSEPLKKSGNNKFAGYSYFELSDFLPSINNIFASLGLCSHISFTSDAATLTVVSIEDGSKVEFTCPMAGAQLKGCHEVQNLGASITYIRRYLYVNALEIVEHDALEPTVGSEKIEQKTEKKPASKTSAKPVNWVAKIEGAKNLDELKAIFADAWKNTEGAVQTECKATYETMKIKLTDEAMEAM